MVQGGIVQLVTEPTEVKYEQTYNGLAYVRVPDGPLKGRLVVVDEAYVK